MTPEAYSHSLKIKNGQTPEELLNAVYKILELGAVNHEVADAVLGAIEAGKYLLPKTIAKIVGQSKSKKLYASTKENLLTDQESLLELHRQSYPDLEIEKGLCDELYRAVADDHRETNLIYRKSVVESLRDQGTASALPTLEAICMSGYQSYRCKEWWSMQCHKMELMDCVLVSFMTAKMNL